MHSIPNLQGGRYACKRIFRQGGKMTIPNALVIIAALFALLALIGFSSTIGALRKRRVLGAAMTCLTALLMLSLAALFGTLSASIQGYRALTKEELAAVVEVQPADSQRFTARFTLPDSSVQVYTLAGDQLYVDARILKWKSIANLIGLHTSYELDRVAGRYERIEDEANKVHTVFALSKHKPVDMFHLRRRFQMLNPLVDAEYGSATFVGSGKPATFRILVSTTGLLVRKSEPDSTR
jgi:hypothetical protein